MANQTGEIFKNWLNSSLSKIKHPKFKGCKRVTNVQPRSIDEHICKTVSETCRVTITMEMEDGGTSSVTGIAKMESIGEGLELAKHCDLYATELRIYSEVISAMEKVILDKGGDKTDFLWPESYYFADNKFIFVDLCESGYKIVPMAVTLDLDHIKLTVAALGKFHAMSMVLKERGELDKTKLNENPLSKNHAFMINYYKIGLKVLADVISSTWEPKWSEVPEKLRKFSKNIEKILPGLVPPLEGKCDIVTHGDCNLRNVLFLYSGSTTPLDAKLIDFQHSAYTNFAFDLVGMLYTSVLPQVREANLDTLLYTHWSSMSETCKLMGYKGTVPTLQESTSWFRSLSPYGLLLSLITLPIFLATEEEGFELDMSIFYETDENTEKSPMNKSLYNIPRVLNQLQLDVQRGLDENIL